MSSPRVTPNRQPNPSGCACHPQPSAQLSPGVNAAQVAPPSLVRVEDVRAADGAVFAQIQALHDQLDGLETFAGSAVIAAPLRTTLAEVHARAATLADLSIRSADQLRERDNEAMRWSSTVGVIRTLAGGFPLADIHHHAVLLRTGMEAVMEVQKLIEQREQAREVAARLEAENAELVAAHVEAAGLRAYVTELEVALNTWRGRGKLGDDAVRRARRNADAARTAARDSAAAELVAGAIESGEVRCLECGRASDTVGRCPCGSTAQGVPASEAG